MSYLYSYVPYRAPIRLRAYYEEFAWYYPRCELQTKRWFVENVREDWVMIDAGANIGYYSILFAQLAARGVVHAFEPTTTVMKLLQNLSEHDIRNVVVETLALGAKEGAIEDSIYRIWGNEAERQIYAFETIDSYVMRRGLKRLDCIKIDVDSFDFEVLQGAEETLATLNPWVVVELNHALSRRNQCVVDALQWLEDRGYREALVTDSDNFILKRGPCDRQATGLTLAFDRRPIDELTLVGPGFSPSGILGDPVSQNGASVTPAGSGWRVDFDGPTWSNVAVLPIDPTLSETLVPIEFDIELEVHEGHLGIGVFDPVVGEFIANEVFAPHGLSQVRVEMPAFAPELVFRNVASGGGRLHFTVRSIVPRCVGSPMQPERPDYVRGGANSLSLKALQAALLAAKEHAAPFADGTEELIGHEDIEPGFSEDEVETDLVVNK